MTLLPLGDPCKNVLSGKQPLKDPLTPTQYAYNIQDLINENLKEIQNSFGERKDRIKNLNDVFLRGYGSYENQDIMSIKTKNFFGGLRSTNKSLDAAYIELLSKIQETNSLIQALITFLQDSKKI